MKEKYIDMNTCSHCRISTSNSCSGYTGRLIEDVNYCITCYPKMVDVHLAEKKLNSKKQMNKTIAETLPQKKEGHYCEGKYYDDYEQYNLGISDCLKSLQDAGVAVVPEENELELVISGHSECDIKCLSRAIRSYLLGKG